MSSFSEIEIRVVNPTEVEALLEIGRTTFVESFGSQNTRKDLEKYIADHFNKRKIQIELNNPNSRFYFAFSGGKIIGYLKINDGEAQTDNKLANALEIERIYVLSEWQGKKIGQQLFEKAKQIANEEKFAYLWLAVWERNVDAIRFYKRNGFKEFDTHPFKLGYDIQRDVLMKLKL